MSNHVLEGNIDFYGELYKSLHENSPVESDDLCLITSELLEENYVTMDCGHRFNYLPLYNDIINCKQAGSLDTQILAYNEIRCPYCRKKQAKLLPYYDNMKIKKIHGVNYVDESVLFSSNYKIGQCRYQKIMNNDVVCCSYKYVSKLKEDGNDYCYQHKKIVKSEILNAILLKKKELKEKEKKEKEMEKKEKSIIKELVKFKKMKEKIEKAKINFDKKFPQLNVVESDEPVVIDNDYCVQILKTGDNKGKKCRMKKTNDDYCLRHYNLCKKMK